jgi:hypothetical protein
LGKAFLTPAGSMTPAPMNHKAFVRMLQQIKTRPEIRRQLGYRNASAFRSYIDSLLNLATRIQRLSPDQAGLTQPNPEYPWWTDATMTQVVAPADYRFPEFDPLQDRCVAKIDKLIGSLLRLAI